MSMNVEHRRVPGAASEIALTLQGHETAPAVFMAHSILSSSMMWDMQAELLASRGWRVIRADTRGHGASDAPAGAYAMGDLVADTIAALDALQIGRVHYVGLSLGGMSGFGLGIHHADRLLSLCLCDARADAPPAFAAPWDDRMAIAQQQGCSALAQSTIERWFGKAFLEVHPAVAQRFLAVASSTTAAGFIGCAQAIQQLSYLPDLARITTPTTLIVGANDGPLPQAMRDISALIAGAELAVIPDAGHLPNIDHPEVFNTALLRHFDRVAAVS